MWAQPAVAWFTVGSVKGEDWPPTTGPVPVLAAKFPATGQENSLYTRDCAPIVLRHAWEPQEAILPYLRSAECAGRAKTNSYE